MKELKSVSGQGFDYSEEYGKYEVKYGEEEVKTFTSLEKAITFYKSLNEPSAIWDLTSVPELLEYKDYEK